MAFEVLDKVGHLINVNIKTLLTNIKVETFLKCTLLFNFWQTRCSRAVLQTELSLISSLTKTLLKKPVKHLNSLIGRAIYDKLVLRTSSLYLYFKNRCFVQNLWQCNVKGGFLIRRYRAWPVRASTKCYIEFWANTLKSDFTYLKPSFLEKK